jgi:hypothetical protein
MVCAVTIRTLKPGSFESFRRDWEPRPWPPQVSRVAICRNEQNPDQILTLTNVDVPMGRLDELRDDPVLIGAEEERLERIAQYEEALVFKGFFEIAEELVSPGAGAQYPTPSPLSPAQASGSPRAS